MFEEAKRLIDEYCINEFGYPADFSDLAYIPIGYTTIDIEEPEDHTVQVAINLVDFYIDTYLDNILVRRWEYDGLEDMINDALPYLTFEELTSLYDYEIEKLYELELIERS